MSAHDGDAQTTKYWCSDIKREAMHYVMPYVMENLGHNFDG